MYFDDLVSKIEKDRPQLIAVAGPPAAGKTTLAARLSSSLGAKALALPMDGFHRDNDALVADGLMERKGSPETFDGRAFVRAVKALMDGRLRAWPGFDRKTDAVLPEAIKLPSQAEIFIVEGNYLLLNTLPWQQLQNLWDMQIWCDVPAPILEERLVQRWLDQGLSRDAAEARARSNDLVNAATIRRLSKRDRALTVE